MWKAGRRICAALCFLAVASTAKAEDVIVEGCAIAGVENGCVMLRSGDKLYNITAAQPKPQIGTAGRVQGTVSNGASLCMQGSILSPARWQPIPDRLCPGTVPAK